MALYPQSFIDDVRMQADIVRVVQEYVPLKKAGASYKACCPFHAEKTPSFVVNPDKGFFHCFGCGVGGDVFKFVELQERVGFLEAVRHLAQKFGIPVPDERVSSGPDAAERELLLKVHEVAAEFFRKQLAASAGAQARQVLKTRGIGAETIERLGIGYAPNTRDALKTHLLRQGFEQEALAKSGLLSLRDDGTSVDRFRGRLMFPIARDTGSIVAFGGRSLDKERQPKYLNSPETAIYTKGRTLYGLHLSKTAIRKLGYAILVEGYFDFAQVMQGGVEPLVASCGTALTTQQAHLLHRFTSKIVLSFDPDPAGQGAAAKSSELLVAEGFQVNVALLPQGDDPDSFVQKRGIAPYIEAVRGSRPYLEYLLDRASRAHDLTRDESRRAFLNEMLRVAATIPDAAMRDQFADRLAHKARITEEVVRSEIRKAAAERRTVLTERELPNVGQVRPAEKGLIWALFHETTQGLEALTALDDDDVVGLATARVLQLARGLHDHAEQDVPPALLARLSTGEAALVAAVAAQEVRPALSARDCVWTLKRLRYEREAAGVREEIDRLQQAGVAVSDELLRRKEELGKLLQRIGVI